MSTKKLVVDVLKDMINSVLLDLLCFPFLHFGFKLKFLVYRDFPASDYLG